MPHIWLVECDPGRLGLRHALIEQTEPALTIAHLLADPEDRWTRIPATPLMLLQGGRELLLPDESIVLQPGDRLLFAGAEGAEALQSQLLDDDVAIDYVRTGQEPPRTWLGRWLQRTALASAPVAAKSEAQG